VRGHAGELEHVLVIATLGAPERRWLRGRRPKAASPTPAPVTTGRATLVTARQLDGPAAAERWMHDAGEAEADAAVTVLNRVLHLYRVATADAQAREVRREQAVVVRVGFGEGEQVAEGRWREAVELPARRPTARRSAALRPQERLAALLGGRDAALACEELALRARQDVDAGRRREAALQLDAALTAALAELAPWAPRADLGARLAELAPWAPRADLGARLAELGELHGGVQAAAHTALEGGIDDVTEAAVRHALERLEAALRARTALGFD
jgi:hypothetical protein